MSTRMFKYQLPGAFDEETVDLLMREKAVIRAIGMQGHEVVVWAETPVDGDPFTVTRRFRVIGTGFDVPDSGTYIGTAFDGPYVWHLYEVPT